MRITPAAAAKIRELMDADCREGAFFRIGVKGGGCQGFEYEMEMDDLAREGDIRLELDGGVLVHDDVSTPFLSDAVIDWKSDLMGDRFEIENPIATSSCGCGISFSV
ncbi:iron-sulfur cluster assembly accessory protein [Roseibium sp. RKSG952]|nr:iron-sulfur cluster assembly accessory protein [Roseibium sp. RKSG952]